MPATASQGALYLICGDDDFAVKSRAKEIYAKWTADLGGMDHEIIDAAAGNSGEALKALGRLRESLQTLPFFGTGKAVWFQNCNFLGTERTANAQAVNESVGELAQELKDFKWGSVRLIISAGEVDKRKAFYKTLDKLGEVEVFSGWNPDKDWEVQAEAWAGGALHKLGKDISAEALAELVMNVGPHPRQMNSEVEKISLYVGNRKEIEIADVNAVCIRNKTARAFAMGDALGDRDLPRLLRTLDEELWSMKLDSKKSEIGLLYGLISKVRTMILIKQMLQEGWIKPESDYYRFKSQLERIPADKLPDDKRYNPLSINAYVLFKALPQSGRYSQEELVEAMNSLLLCNQKLVSSALDGDLILQQTLIQIASKPLDGSSKAARAVR